MWVKREDILKEQILIGGFSLEDLHAKYVVKFNALLIYEPSIKTMLKNKGGYMYIPFKVNNLPIWFHTCYVGKNENKVLIHNI